MSPGHYIVCEMKREFKQPTFLSFKPDVLHTDWIDSLGNFLWLPQPPTHLFYSVSTCITPWWLLVSCSMPQGDSLVTSSGDMAFQLFSELAFGKGTCIWVGLPLHSHLLLLVVAASCCCDGMHTRNSWRQEGLFRPSFRGFQPVTVGEGLTCGGSRNMAEASYTSQNRK